MYTLITSASSAKAYRLKNQLNRPDIILGDYHELPGIMIESGQMMRLPSPQNPAYVHEMLTLCLDKQINQIHVIDTNEASLLNEARQLLNEYGIELINYPQ